MKNWGEHGGAESHEEEGNLGDGPASVHVEDHQGQCQRQSFTYTAAGIYTVKGRIADKDGGFTDYTTTITVDPSNQGGGPAQPQPQLQPQLRYGVFPPSW